MHIVLGTGERQSFAYREFSAYYRSVRGRFLAAAREDRLTRPYPVSHCGLCHHARACEAQWEREDHLSLVANIRCGVSSSMEPSPIPTAARAA